MGLSHVESCVIGSAPNRRVPYAVGVGYIRWQSFLPYEIRKARASRAGREREREGDKEAGRRKRKAMREGGIEGGGGAMVREPPPWRNDAALLSKIASQEKLRAELPSLPSLPPRVLLLFLFRNTLSPSERPLGFSYRNRYDGSRNPKDFTLKYCRK